MMEFYSYSCHYQWIRFRMSRRALQFQDDSTDDVIVQPVLKRLLLTGPLIPFVIQDRLFLTQSKAHENQFGSNKLNVRGMIKEKIVLLTSCVRPPRRIEKRAKKWTQWLLSVGIPVVFNAWNRSSVHQMFGPDGPLLMPARVLLPLSTFFTGYTLLVVNIFCHQKHHLIMT